MSRSSAYCDKCTQCGSLSNHISGRCRKCRLINCAICRTTFDPRHKVTDTCADCLKRIATATARGQTDAAARLKEHYRRIDAENTLTSDSLDVPAGTGLDLYLRKTN